jgi:hypothetical protein
VVPPGVVVLVVVDVVVVVVVVDDELVGAAAPVADPAAQYHVLALAPGGAAVGIAEARSPVVTTG